MGYIECTHACNCEMYTLNFDAKIKLSQIVVSVDDLHVLEETIP